MDVMEIIQGRRSVRRYLDTPLTEAQIEQLIDSAIWAPSGGNAQSWRFVIIQDPARIQQLRMFSPGLPGPPPCVIAVCQDMECAEHSGARLGRERLSLFDSAMAAQNILLSAHAMGLGSCVVASFHASAVSRLLRLPSNVEPVLLVAVGCAEHHPDAPLRLRKEVVSRETYEG